MKLDFIIEPFVDNQGREQDGLGFSLERKENNILDYRYWESISSRFYNNGGDLELVDKNKWLGKVISSHSQEYECQIEILNDKVFIHTSSKMDKIGGEVAYYEEEVELYYDGRGKYRYWNSENEHKRVTSSLSKTLGSTEFSSGKLYT